MANLRNEIREALTHDWDQRKADARQVVEWLRDIHGRLYQIGEDAYREFFHRLTAAFGHYATDAIETEWNFSKLLTTHEGKMFMQNFHPIKQFVDGNLSKSPEEYEEDSDELGDWLGGAETSEPAQPNSHHGVSSTDWNYIKKSFPYLQDDHLNDFPNELHAGHPLWWVQPDYWYAMSSPDGKYQIYHGQMMGTSGDIELINTETGKVEVAVDPEDPNAYDQIVEWANSRGFREYVVHHHLDEWVQSQDDLAEPPWMGTP